MFIPGVGVLPYPPLDQTFPRKTLDQTPQEEHRTRQVVTLYPSKEPGTRQEVTSYPLQNLKTELYASCWNAFSLRHFFRLIFVSAQREHYIGFSLNLSGGHVAFAFGPI